MPPFDWSKLALLGGLSPSGGAPFLRGYTRGQEERRQQQEREDQRRRQDELLKIQQAQEQRAVEDQQMQRQQQMLTGVRSIRQLLEDPSIDDPALFDQRMTFAQQFAPMVGVDPGFVQSLRPAPDVFAKRKLTKLLDDFEKRPMSERQQAEAAIYWEVGGQRYTPAQARQMLGRGGMDTRTGQPFAFTPTPEQDTPNTPEEQFYQRYATERDKPSFAALSTSEQAAARTAWTKADDKPPDPTLQAIRELTLAQQRTAQTMAALPPRLQRQVDTQTKGFDSQPVVKQVQTMAQAVEFANAMNPNTMNPADDQALIYAFAKAMDPDSVVREGEYATVRKYAQSWAERFGFNVARIFSNTQFLTPAARANMKATIQQRYAAVKKQYDNVRSQYATRINRMTGGLDGEDYLIDYGAAFPATTPAATDGASTSSPRGGVANPFRR